MSKGISSFVSAFYVKSAFNWYLFTLTKNINENLFYLRYGVNTYSM